MADLLDFPAAKFLEAHLDEMCESRIEMAATGAHIPTMGFSSIDHPHASPRAGCCLSVYAVCSGMRSSTLWSALPTSVAFA